MNNTNFINTYKGLINENTVEVDSLVIDGTDITAKLTELELAIDNEESSRITADTTLQNNINTEASTRASADTTLQTNINTEASTRASADTTLQNNIDSEESARITADNTLQTNINSEASTRASADDALDGRIDTLETITTGITYNSTSDTTTIGNNVLINKGSGNIDFRLSSGEAGTSKMYFIENSDSYGFTTFYEGSGNNFHIARRDASTTDIDCIKISREGGIDLYDDVIINNETADRLIYLDSNKKITSNPDNYTWNDLKTILDDHPGDLTNLNNRLTIAEGDIDDLETKTRYITSPSDFVTEIDNILRINNISTEGVLFIDQSNNNKLTASNVTKTSLEGFDGRITSNGTDISALEQKTQDLTRTGITQSTYLLETDVNFSIYQSDPTNFIKLDLKRGSSNWGSDTNTDFRLLGQTGDYYFQLGNQGNTNNIMVMNGGTNKLQLPQITANTIPYLDSNQDLVESDLTVQTGYYQLENNLSVWNSAGGDAYLELKIGSADWGYDNWDWRFKNNGGTLRFLIGKTNDGAETEVYHIDGTSLEIRLTQLTEDKILYLNSSKSITSSSLSHSEIVANDTLLNNLYYTDTTNFTRDTKVLKVNYGTAENDALIIIQEADDYGFYIKYDGVDNIFQIQRNNVGTVTSCLTIDRNDGEIRLPEISNPDDSNHIYLDSTGKIKSSPLWYNESTEVLETDKPIAINSSQQGISFQGGTQGYVTLTQLYGLRFFLQDNTEVSNIDKKSFKFTSDDGETIELSTPAGGYGFVWEAGEVHDFNIYQKTNTDFTIGYNSGIRQEFDLSDQTIIYKTSDSPIYYFKMDLGSGRLDLFNTTVSTSTPVMRMGETTGFFQGRKVKYKYPTTSGGWFNETSLNTGNGFLYELAYNSSASSVINANWGRYDSTYCINFRKNVNVNGTTVHTSDERIKQDIEDNTKPSLEIINAIQLKEYNYKYRPNGTVKNIGVIAQQIQTDIDNVYGTDIIDTHDSDTSLGISDDNYNDLLSIKKEKMYMFLIGAVQELTQQVNDLKARVNVLES